MLSVMFIYTILFFKNIMSVISVYIRPVRFYVFQFRFEFDSIKFKTSIFDSVSDFRNIFDSISIFNTPVNLYHIYIQGLQACTSIMQVTYNL